MSQQLFRWFKDIRERKNHKALGRAQTKTRLHHMLRCSGSNYMTSNKHHDAFVTHKMAGAEGGLGQGDGGQPQPQQQQATSC